MKSGGIAGDCLYTTYIFETYWGVHMGRVVLVWDQYEVDFLSAPPAIEVLI